MAESQHVDAGKQATPDAVKRSTKDTATHGSASALHGGYGDPRLLTPQTILALQRTAGNRAVNALLQQRAPLPLQRGPSPNPGMTVTHIDPNPGMTVTPIDPHAGMTVTPIVEPKHDKPLQKQARDAFVTDRDMFANLWLTAATTALAGAPEVQDPESTQNWWVALGGNLLWAATSFVAPEAVAVIRMMSVVGASVGSGVLAVTPVTAPSGKAFISGLLTTTRDALVKSANGTMDSAAQECGDQEITDREEQRKVLWGRFFATSYNESEPIRAIMSDKIEKGLASFLKQWHEWQQLRQGGAGQGAGAEPEDIPFTPQLNFG